MIDRPALPVEHHFAKYCSTKVLICDPDSNDVVGIAPQAYRPRPIDDGELSGNHLEFFKAPSIAEDVAALAKHLTDSKLLTIRPSGRFAVGQVGQMKVAAKSCGVEIEIIEDPIVGPPADPAHALIMGISLNALLAQEELAKVATPYKPPLPPKPIF